MTLETWRSPSGLVHARRRRNFVGTRYERVTTEVRMLCGAEPPLVHPTAEPRKVTCEICVKAMNTRAHLAAGDLS